MISTQVATHENRKKPKTVFPGLNLFRSSLAIWVATAHTAMLCGLSWIPDPKVAVMGFMMLSGFLISSITRTFDDGHEPTIRYWTEFLVRRFLRIAPLHFTLLIPSFAFFEFYKTHRAFIDAALQLPIRHYHAPDIPNVLSHLTYTYGFIPAHSNAVVIPDWSLAPEMQFYFIFPLIFWLMRKPSTRLASGVAVIALVLVSKLTLQQSFPEPTLIGLTLNLFGIGILIEKIKSTPHPRGPSFEALWIAPFAVLSGRCFLPALVMAYLLSKSIELRTRPRTEMLFKWLSERSYSIYLIHLLIVIPLISWSLSHAHLSGLTPVQRFLTLSPLIAGLTLLTSDITYRLIERPLIRLGPRLFSHQGKNS